MLRVSAQSSNTEVDILSINGDVDAAAKGVEFGVELMLFAESIATRNEETLVQTREELATIAGDVVLVEAAGVAANFQRMVRIADSMGIPVDNLAAKVGTEVRQELGIDRFASAKNSQV